MNYRRYTKKILAASIALSIAPMAMAQDVSTDQDAMTEDQVMEEVIVTGSIRDAMANSLETKRSSDNLIEAIYADDIGKLPDQNLAEVLENITGCLLYTSDAADDFAVVLWSGGAGAV